MTHNTIKTDILEILANCSIVGDNIALPPSQLDRTAYVAVNKVLELMGGKWNRSKKVHVFWEAPNDLLDAVLLTGQITDKKKLFQFYETPKDLAREMATLADCAGKKILEPSAGRGRLIEAAVNNATGFDNCQIVAIDSDPANIAALAEMRNKWLHANDVNFGIVEGDFLRKGVHVVFDRVIMNPPFTRGQSITHINHALKFLKPGGKLIGICPNGPREQAALRPLADMWRELPSGTFAESGTNVNTVLLVIHADPQKTSTTF